MCPARYRAGGSLLHCLSTLTKSMQDACFGNLLCKFPPGAKSARGGLFLLHWPWSRLHRTLSGILPCEARTFLTCHTDSRDHLSYLYPLPVPLRPGLLHLKLYVKTASANKLPAYGISGNIFAVNSQKILQKL